MKSSVRKKGTRLANVVSLLAKANVVSIQSHLNSNSNLSVLSMHDKKSPCHLMLMSNELKKN